MVRAWSPAHFRGVQADCSFRARTRLDVHHVLKRAQGVSDFDLDRLVALCRGCHERTDAPYAKGRLTVTPVGAGRFVFAVVRGGGKAEAALVDQWESLWPQGLVPAGVEDCLRDEVHADRLAAARTRQAVAGTDEGFSPVLILTHGRGLSPGREQSREGAECAVSAETAWSDSTPGLGEVTNRAMIEARGGLCPFNS